jgi:hypothetical protein
MGGHQMMEKLPLEVETALPAIRDEWLRVGLSTEPAGRGTAMDGVREAYRTAGLAEPKLVIWLDSPLAGCCGAALLRAMLPDRVGAQVRAQVWDQVWAQVWDQVGDQVWDQVGDQVRDQVWAQVWDRVGAQVWAQVRDRVGAQVRAQVWDQVWAQVWDQVGAQVWAQVGAQVRDQVWAQVWDRVGAQVWAQVRDQVWAQVWDRVGAQVWAQVRDQVWDRVGAQVWAQVRDQVSRCAYGSHEASWLSFYDTFERAGISGCERLRGMGTVARSAGWWWPFAGAVILTERPERLERDDRGRLHSPTGMAIRYPDGFGVYAWHGVRVPAEVIERPEMLDVARITNESNAEVRGVMLERYGLERYVRECGARVLDRSDYGTLWRAELPNDEPLVLVEVENSTPEPDQSRKRYMIRVPPTIERAREAVSWSFGMGEQEYAPAAES